MGAGAEEDQGALREPAQGEPAEGVQNGAGADESNPAGSRIELQMIYRFTQSWRRSLLGWGLLRVENTY